MVSQEYASLYQCSFSCKSSLSNYKMLSCLFAFYIDFQVWFTHLLYGLAFVVSFYMSYMFDMFFSYVMKYFCDKNESSPKMANIILETIPKP